MKHGLNSNFKKENKMSEYLDALNKETREAWEVNAEVWDDRMGDEGNDFFNILC
jgi:hypothetical protein